jgi:cbb3-type cytochrome oxidase subunit 1
VIFAFGGNALMATSFYVVQRTSPRGCGAATSLVRVLGLPAVHRHGGNRLPARHPRRARNTPSPNGTDLWLTIVWVAFLPSSSARS